MITNPPDDFQLLPTDQVSDDVLNFFLFFISLMRFHRTIIKTSFRYFNLNLHSLIGSQLFQVFVLMQFDPGLEYKPNYKGGTTRGKDENS